MPVSAYNQLDGYQNFQQSLFEEIAYYAIIETLVVDSMFSFYILSSNSRSFIVIMRW